MIKFFTHCLFAICLCFIVGCSNCSSSGRKKIKQDNNQSTENNRPSRQRTNSSSRDINPLPSNPTLADVANYAEQCVFLVYPINGNQSLGQGTGFFIREDGLAISNFHVFAPGTEWAIETIDGRRFRVSEIVKSSESFDFVVFKVENNGENFPSLKLANQTPRKGEDILVLGNPKGLESTLTKGIISAIRSQTNKDDLLQFDAAISPGSSGSPVINLQGAVVGIATKKLLDCENCNFAYNIQLTK